MIWKSRGVNSQGRQQIETLGLHLLVFLFFLVYRSLHMKLQAVHACQRFQIKLTKTLHEAATALRSKVGENEANLDVFIKV